MATRSRSIPTPSHLTGKRALLRVSAHVSLEIATLRRSIPTSNHLTSKGALLRVSAQVNNQMFASLCCIATAQHAALVGALLRHGLALGRPVSVRFYLSGGALKKKNEKKVGQRTSDFCPRLLLILEPQYGEQRHNT